MLLQVDEDGEGMSANLEGIAAGSRLEGLAFYCLDGSGKTASCSTAGKVQVSWVPSFKKVDLHDGPLSLPPLQARAQSFLPPRVTGSCLKVLLVW